MGGGRRDDVDGVRSESPPPLAMPRATLHPKNKQPPFKACRFAHIARRPWQLFKDIDWRAIRGWTTIHFKHWHARDMCVRACACACACVRACVCVYACGRTSIPYCHHGRPESDRPASGTPICRESCSSDEVTVHEKNCLVSVRLVNTN